MHGESAEKLFKLQKAGNITCERISLLALVKNKCIAPFVFYGPCNTGLFNDWVRTFLLKELKPGQTVIMDNAAFHKSQATKALLESVGGKLLYLPPYSPDVNPIEHFWANMKRWFKSRWSQTLKIFDLICFYFNIPILS